MAKPTKVKYDVSDDDQCESDACRSDEEEEEYSKEELMDMCEQVHTCFEMKRKECKELRKKIKTLEQSFDELNVSHESLREDHEKLGKAHSKCWCFGSLTSKFIVCASGPDGVLGGHKDYNSSGRTSLCLVYYCSCYQHWGL